MNYLGIFENMQSAETSFFVIAGLLVVAAIICIILCISYLNCKNDLLKTRGQLEDAIFKSRNALSDKQELEETIIFVRNQLEKEQVKSQNLSDKLAEKLVIEQQMQEKLDTAAGELTMYKELEAKKKLERAKKAAETRKKNKEKNQQSVEKVVD